MLFVEHALLFIPTVTWITWFFRPLFNDDFLCCVMLKQLFYQCWWNLYFHCTKEFNYIPDETYYIHYRTSVYNIDIISMCRWPNTILYLVIAPYHLFFDLTDSFNWNTHGGTKVMGYLSAAFCLYILISPITKPWPPVFCSCSKIFLFEEKAMNKLLFITMQFLL